MVGVVGVPIQRCLNSAHLHDDDVDWHLRADGTVDGRSPDLGDVRGGLLRFAVQRYSGPFLAI